MLYQIGGFVTGAALSSVFVFNMNDLIYSQLRRNMIAPIVRMSSRRNNAQSDANENMNTSTLEELKDLGRGTINFVSQFKPLGLEQTRVKDLLMDDVQYATPADNYFAYINKRKRSIGDALGDIREQQVLENLGLQNVLPPYYNAMKNQFEIQTSDKEIIREIKEVDPNAELDEIEIARINQIRQQNLEKLIENKIKESEPQSSQKFNKKDYAKLEKMSFKDIINKFDPQTEKRRFRDADVEKLIADQSLPESMVKLEKKKKVKKSRDEILRQQEEIARLLESPQSIEGRDKALELAEQQSIQAKEVTVKDLKRLRRLKRKAEKEEQKMQMKSQVQQTEVSASNDNNQAQQKLNAAEISQQKQQVQDIKSTVKIDTNSIVDSNLETDENIDNLIK